MRALRRLFRIAEARLRGAQKSVGGDVPVVRPRHRAGGTWLRHAQPTDRPERQNHRRSIPRCGELRGRIDHVVKRSIMDLRDCPDPAALDDVQPH
jgi:hypothetical protein